MPRPTPVPGPAGEPAAVVRRVRTAMSDLTAPTDSRISPDGRRVAVTVLGPRGADVLIAPADGPALPLPTAPSDPDGGSRHTPRWLPDSRTVLLVTEPAGPGRPVLTAWDTRTGARRELAAVPGAVEDLTVSDDGTEVLLLIADDGAERDGMNLGLPVRLGPDPTPVSYRPDAGRRRLLHGLLPSADASSPSAPVVLRDAGPAGLTVWNAAWRGGRTVVATVSEDPLPAGYYHARLARIDLADGRAVTLHEPRGQLAAPALSADGRRAAAAEGISIVAGRPLLVDLADDTVTTVAGAEDVTWLQFHPHDPDRLLTAGPSGTGTRVADVRAGTVPSGAGVTVLREEQAVLTGAGAQPALSLSGDGLTAATVREAPGIPPQAVVAPTSGPDAWTWRPVTAPDPAAARRDGGHGDLARVRTRQIAWTASDGAPVHGLLLDAPGTPVPAGMPRTAPRARPLAVALHGGPSWQWSAGYAPADVLGLAPALAAAGWLVLLPNPRGSSGYGLDHARAAVGAVGDGDLDDVLSGVAHLVAEGEALPGRFAVLGHSYGGFLAALAAARTDVFRAAVVVSAPTDWLSFAHTSVIGGGYEQTYAIGDARTPEGRTALIGRSPLFADGGSGTPTLVLHGEHDRVTPLGQAHELYRALARRGTAPVELHVYPAEGHEFTGPAHLLDAAARAEEWLTRHVVGEAQACAAHHTRARDADPGLVPGTKGAP
ncbi:alpha/beta fold hydrolase [Streptomyces sp. NPDC102451]|uniref:S9 family peptidase n=1 Tax=Streptomyces sp. NPDC102451 TaxID=3366177 RepID=UPI00381EF4C2